jgi:endonuclease III
VQPARILAAEPGVLAEVAGAGILALNQADKLRDSAALALQLKLHDLRQWPARQARSALKRFPSIGDPGADKVLLFSRCAPVMALDSNGVRALVRLGWARESKNYSTTYTAVLAAVEPLLESDVDVRMRAYLLLRRHGQELCRRTSPRCEACPLADGCAYFKARRAES